MGITIVENRNEYFGLLTPVRYIAENLILSLFIAFASSTGLCAQSSLLQAGVGKSNITNTEPGTIVNDSLYVKSLVIRNDEMTAALITIDVVALERIGHLPDNYLSDVRKTLQQRFNIDPGHVIVNASHCHGVPSGDVVEKTILAVEQALLNIEAVKVGTTRGFEDRISINRRLFLRNGKERDIRHAYSLPPDDSITGVGKIDPELGILSLMTDAGKPLALLYNFACHPIQGVPSKGRRDNTAGFPGFASRLIEDTYGEGTMALFFQGCAGDINPIDYKNISFPRSSEPLGVFVGSSVLKEMDQMEYGPSSDLQIIREELELPMADLRPAIDSLEKRKKELVANLTGTSLNFESFLELYLKHHLFEEYPSNYAHLYMHEKARGRESLALLDEENQGLVSAYRANIQTMEELTVVKTNIALLHMHQKDYMASESKRITVEINVVKIGDFVLVTFPGELSVEIGLNIKEKSPFKNTFVSGYTNGYIYYSPTEQQLKNRGGAQEDTDCMLDMGWQHLFEDRVLEILKAL